MSEAKPKKLSNMAQAIMTGQIPAYRAVPSIQSGWDALEVDMMAKQWPAKIIEICRQAYFSGAMRLQEILIDMPSDKDSIERTYKAIDTEFREYQQDMLARKPGVSE